MTVSTAVPPPAWFTNSIGERPQFREVVVNAATIRMRCWGPENAPGLVLVHGGSAHSGWWDHVAPMLASSHRVVAPDLSGHGDSDARPNYPMTLWADEVLASADAGGIVGPPLIVGHSMGGWVAATAGARHGNNVRGLVMVDSPLIRHVPESSIAGLLGRTARTYASKAEILKRFRTEPAQDSLVPFVVQHVAEQSVRHTEAGWRWKSDPELLRKRHHAGGLPDSRDLIPNTDVPSVFIRCEHGMVTPEMATDIGHFFNQRATMVDLADAGHHPMMDQPLALVAVLRAVLALRGARG